MAAIEAATIFRGLIDFMVSDINSAIKGITHAGLCCIKNFLAEKVHIKKNLAQYEAHDCCARLWFWKECRFMQQSPSHESDVLLQINGLQ